MQLKSSFFIVTGGSSGLGLACVQQLASQGAQVAIFDLNEPRAIDSEEFKDQITYHKVNVTDEQSIKSALKKIKESQAEIHGLVQCAGIAFAKKTLSKDGPTDFSLFEKTIQVNLLGSYRVLQQVAWEMSQNATNEDGERGVIVMTASVAAFDGQVGQAAYSASKGGIVGMTLPLAREFSRLGIRVATIAPGLFKTPMMESLPQAAQDSLAAQVPFPQRLGKPSEFALLAQHIIENPMINGEVIRLDGALRMGMK